MNHNPPKGPPPEYTREDLDKMPKTDREKVRAAQAKRERKRKRTEKP